MMKEDWLNRLVLAIVVGGVLMILFAPWANAQGTTTGITPKSEPNLQSDVNVGVVSKPSATASSESTSDANAVVGDVNNTSASNNDNNNANNNTNEGNTVTVTDKRPSTLRIRNNASIGLGSTQTTADCWVGGGIGGSAGFGAFVINRSKRDKACFALVEFENLRELGLYSQAAEARCEKKAGLWEPFGDVETCISQVTVAITPKPSEPAPEPAVYQTVAASDKDQRALEKEVKGLERKVQVLEKALREEHRKSQRVANSAVRKAEKAETQFDRIKREAIQYRNEKNGS